MQSTAGTPTLTDAEKMVPGEEFLANAIVGSQMFYEEQGFKSILDFDASTSGRMLGDGTCNGATVKCSGHCGGDRYEFIIRLWEANKAD